ncbi:MAG: isopropylmalate isomerase [Pseudomonadota bacterium]
MWSPQIGDPTFMGWATVVAYIVATLLALLTLMKGPGRQRVFWFVLTALLFLLAINKQLDLQSALTAAGRCLANAQGWYDNRRVVQIIFISTIAIIAALTALMLAWTMRRDLPQIWLALLGVVFLLAFVAIRAAGFHHFDWFIGYQIGGIRMNWVLELGGIILIAANALFLLVRRPRY